MQRDKSNIDGIYLNLDQFLRFFRVIFAEEVQTCYELHPNGMHTALGGLHEPGCKSRPSRTDNLHTFSLFIFTVFHTSESYISSCSFPIRIGYDFQPGSCNPPRAV